MDPEVQGVLTTAAQRWPHIHISDSLVMADRAVKMVEEGCTTVAVLGVDFMSENVRAILNEAGHKDAKVSHFHVAQYSCQTHCSLLGHLHLEEEAFAWDAHDIVPEQFLGCNFVSGCIFHILGQMPCFEMSHAITSYSSYVSAWLFFHSCACQCSIAHDTDFLFTQQVFSILSTVCLGSTGIPYGCCRHWLLSSRGSRDPPIQSVPGSGSRDRRPCHACCVHQYQSEDQGSGSCCCPYHHLHLLQCGADSSAGKLFYHKGMSLAALDCPCHHNLLLIARHCKRGSAAVVIRVLFDTVPLAAGLCSDSRPDCLVWP